MRSRLLWGLIINSLSFYIVSRLVPGLHFNGTCSIIFAVIILGVINTIVRPILLIVSVPLTIFTFGLFIFVINGFMLEIASYLVKGFSISSFGSAILGAFLLSVVSTVLNWLLYPKRVN